MTSKSRFNLRNMKLPRFSIPVLTKAEKTAVIVLALVLSSGTALRAWEHSGTQIGPVKDWDTLRALVLQAKQAAGSDTIYPCFEPPPMATGEHWPERSQDSSEKGLAGASPLRHAVSKKSPPTAPMDINVVGAFELQSLPGIGPSTAKIIISHRNTHGKFTTPESLMEVKGIGPKKFARIKEFIRTGPIAMKSKNPEEP